MTDPTITGITTIYEFSDGSYDVSCSERGEDGRLHRRWDHNWYDALTCGLEIQSYLKIRKQERDQAKGEELSY